MAEKHRFKKNREFKKRIDENEENEEGDIRSFKFHRYDLERFDTNKRRRNSDSDSFADKRDRKGDRKGDWKNDRRNDRKGDRRNDWKNDRKGGKNFSKGGRKFNRYDDED